MNLGPFRLVHPRARTLARQACWDAPEGWICTFDEPKRNLEQNARLHSLIGDIVKAKTEWNGRTWAMDDWKALLVSAHAKALNLTGEAIAGLEGEVVILRRQTSRMGKKELSSLISYIEAWMVARNIPIRDGF